MRWQSQAEYDAFVDEIAREALDIYNAYPSWWGDGETNAYDHIADRVEQAVVDRVSRAQIIAYFNGDEAELLNSERFDQPEVIPFDAMARLECDIHDRMWKLAHAALGEQ